MSLTDDWKNGELQEGYYYVKVTDGSIMIFWYNKEHILDVIGWEVIAPVPSYEELQELKNFDGKNVCAENEVLEIKVAELIETNDSLSRQVKHLLDLQKEEDKEVESLRDLLKECKEHMYFQKEIDNETITLLTSINNTIGESEECLK